ncbi:MAG: hypothetical protein ACHRXM_14105 [Isosphaerales bacterium]
MGKIRLFCERWRTPSDLMTARTRGPAAVAAVAAWVRGLPQDDKKMTQAFRQQAAAGEIRAVGICHDVRTIPPGQTEKTDAICLGLEHQTGQCISVFLPYKKGWFSKVQYCALFATKRDAQFFVQP